MLFYYSTIILLKYTNTRRPRRTGRPAHAARAAAARLADEHEAASRRAAPAAGAPARPDKI